MIRNITLSIIGAAVLALFMVVAVPVAQNGLSLEVSKAHALGGNNGGSVGSGGSSGGTCCSTGGGGGGYTPTPTPTPDPEPEPPICKFLNADKTTLPHGGGTVTLSWASEKGTSATLTPDGSSVALTGSKTVSVTSDTTFVFRVSNSDGNDSCQVRVTVNPPEEKAPKCDSFTVSPTSLPYGGGSVTLTWATTDAGRVTINNGIGEVAADGSRTVSVTQTTVFTLTAEKAGQSSASCTAKVVVGPEEPKPITCADNVTFRASDTSLPRGGGNVTFTWSTTGIDSVRFNGLSSTALSGSETVNVTSDRTFTLIATEDGTSVSCPISVDVATGGGGGGGSSSPRCELKISKKEIRRGDEVTLTWDSSRATEMKLVDNHGNVLVKGDDKDDLEGSLKVKPTKDTTYTLTVSRGSRDRDCKVSVDVKDGVTVTETRNQGLVAGISLTQLPYTGFEAGPMLTTIFYGLLVLWGLFVAYVVAVRRDMIGGISLAGAHTHVPYTEASAPTTAAADYVAAATATDIPANLPTGTPTIGYAALATEEVDEAAAAMTALEDRAHAQKALFSSDAMRYFMKVTPEAEYETALDAVIARAKAAFPTEDGWLVVNLARLESVIAPAVTATPTPATVLPGNGGSLAEAIATGNVVAAYALIANRPMIALADAAAEFDSVIRARRGEAVSISAMLEEATKAHTDETIAAAVKALTGALDGVYTSEADAVKMAIMKAVKVLG